MAIVGLEKLYYAKITKDDEKELIYDTPEYLAGVREIGVTPSINTEKLYAENKLWEQDSAIEAIDVTIDLADLSNKQSSILLGHQVAEGGGIIATEDDIAPYVALLYKANKSDGSARYQILYKGKFELPSDDAKGKEGQTNFQTPQMKATFQPTRNNGAWKYQVDSNDEGISPTIETDFFTEVVIAKAKIEIEAPSLVNTVAKGSASGTTKITATKGVGNSLGTVVQATPVAKPNVGDLISNATAYTTGDDLAVTVGQFVGLYELDVDNKVVKFANIEIKTADVLA